MTIGFEMKKNMVLWKFDNNKHKKKNKNDVRGHWRPPFIVGRRDTLRPAADTRQSEITYGRLRVTTATRMAVVVIFWETGSMIKYSLKSPVTCLSVTYMFVIWVYLYDYH